MGGRLMPQKQYLDDNGNPIKQYLDDSGNPIADPSKSALGKMESFKSAPATPFSPEWFQRGGLSRSPFSDPWVKEKLFNAADTATKAMPAAGATLGAIAGTAGGVPGMTAGAALGGGAGTAAQQLSRRAIGFQDTPQTSSEAAGQIGKEALVQGALELGTAGAARGLRALAPKMAESALSVSERMRGSGRTIGDAVLENTTGVRMGTLAQQTKNKIASLTSQMEQGVSQATQGGAVGTSNPAHAVLDNAIQNTPRNATSVLQKLNDLKGALELDPANPRRIHTPDELLELKRGIGKEIKSWPVEWQKLGDVQRIQQQLYGAIDGELDRLVPGNAEINQQISSLIPAKQQAVRKSMQATLGQKIVNRMAVHTGALAGAGLGYMAGSKEGGTAGGIVGGLAGLVAPEMIANPATQMTAARLAYGAPAIQKYGAIPLRFLLSPSSE